MTHPIAPDAEQAYAVLQRALAERRPADAAIIGIHSGGAWIAQRLARDLGIADLGFLDISFYRDDFDRIGLHAEVKPTHIPFAIEGRSVILVDDVLYNGRTARAAMNLLFDYGRPQRIELAALVDRQSPDQRRELPIAATYAGATVTLPIDVQLVLQHAGDALAFAIERADLNPPASGANR